MKQIILTINIIAILVFPLLAQQTITLEPYMPKDSFLVGEPIDFGMTIVNASNSTIKERFTKIVSFRILKENNEDLPYKGRVMYNMSGLILELKPNEEINPIFDLIDLYGQEYKNAALYLYIPTGKYSIEVTFSPLNMQQQKINIPFKIIEPQGDNEIVYNTFIRLVTRKHTSSEEAEILESLYHKYPNSVYMPFLLNVLEVCYGIKLNDYSKALAIKKELVETYPSSNIAHQELEAVLKSMTNDAERIKYLEKIQTKSKGTFMGKVYENKIKAITAKEEH